MAEPLDPDTEEPEADESTGLEEVWERAMQRFDTAAEPSFEIRAQALEARRFVTVPGAMWEGTWGEMNENAPRPEVDKITKSLEKIETDYRENRLTVDFVPVDDVADSDTADTLDGMHRADSYHFKAMQSRDNAFQEGIRGGFGAWRLCTDYADPYDKDSDAQRINPAMVIVDADQSVYFDPASKLYDKSDAEWAFVVVADPRATAIEKWGEDDIAPWPIEQWQYAYDWYTPDVVRIAEYYEVEDKSDKLIILNNPLTEEEQRYFSSEIEPAQIEELTVQGWEKRTRSVKRKRVHKYIMNGSKVLKDCGYIAGCNIPIVPFYGRRDWVDNMERFRGHVGKKMDRQRIYNSSVAKIVETQSLAPYEVPIVAPEQVAGMVGPNMTMLEHWARGNIDRAPVRLLNPLRNPDGSIAQTGPIGKIEPPQVQPATAALLQLTSADLTDDDENADEVKSNVSAEAMDIAADRVDLKSAIYLDNMRQSLQREAEIYLDMAREVYYEPGRRVDTLSMDEQEGTAVLSEPVIDKNGVYRIRNDLAKGKYKVIASVQESTTTKRQKVVKQNLGIAEIAGGLGDQDLGRIALLIAVMNQDGEGQQDMQKYARNQLISLGVVEPTPEEQQQIAQAQAAQGQQEPSATEKAVLAQAEELQSKAKLNAAKAEESASSAILKLAQAEAVGGPVSEPETPSGLTAANDAAMTDERFASADLKRAQADRLRHEIGEKRVRMGHEIEMDRRDRDIAEKRASSAA